jgi:hypothetical protein
MCIYLMKIHGIRRVYYSDASGNICYQKLNQIDDEEDQHFSHGLKLMVVRCTCIGSIAAKKLPLTREQKTYLMSLATKDI